MLQQKFTVQVTPLPYCDDITRFDGYYKCRYLDSEFFKNILFCCWHLAKISTYYLYMKKLSHLCSYHDRQLAQLKSVDPASYTVPGIL